MHIRILLAFGLGLSWAGAASAQANPPALDKAAMERALQQADGPRRRILEAARLKTASRATEVPPAAAAPQTVAAAAPTPARARAEAAAEPEPVVLGTLPSGGDPVQVSAASVATVAKVAPVELATTTVSMITSPAAAVAAPAPAPAPAPEAARSALPAAAASPLPLPRLLSKVDPQMPAYMFRRGNVRAEVLVDLIVNADGSVSNVVVRAPSSTDLVPPVVEALRQWRYEAQRAPRPIVVRLVVSPS